MQRKKDPSVRRLTRGEFNFTNVMFAPDYRHFTVLCSNVSTPASSLLYSVDKGLIRQLGDSRGDAYDLELEKGNIPVSEVHFITTEDGFTIPAIITWPLELEKGKNTRFWSMFTEGLTTEVLRTDGFYRHPDTTGRAKG